VTARAPGPHQLDPDAGACPWRPPPEPLVLGPDDVHAWRVGLDVDAPALGRLRATLSPDERRRAAAFHADRHRRRFVAARGALRAILARYLAIPPERVALDTGRHGKPRLGGGGDLRFNVSHAADLAVCAVARGREVGVDVEQVRHDLAGEAVAARVLSAAEAAALATAPDERRTATFFDLWTRKEAYGKGLGTGLGALERLEVVPEPAGWILVPLATAPGFAATIAIEGKEYRLSCWDLVV